MFDFKTAVEQNLKEVLSRHNLRLITLDQSEVLLIGRGFAISVSYDREGVDVGYLELTSDGAWLFHRITNMLATQRFTQQDRDLYGAPPAVVDERIKASLRVIASGLTNRCDDIFGGDKSWLTSLRKKDAEKWKGLAAPGQMVHALSSAPP